MARLASSQPSFAMADDETSTGFAVEVARPGPRKRHALLERRSLAGLLMVLATVWVGVVFAGALTNANELRVRAAQERRVNEDLRAQVDAARREIESAQGKSLLAQLARTYGMGDPAERSFTLVPGAPAARPIVPLGREPEPVAAPGPFDDLLDLFLGPAGS